MLLAAEVTACNLYYLAISKNGVKPLFSTCVTHSVFFLVGSVVVGQGDTHPQPTHLPHPPNSFSDVRLRVKILLAVTYISLVFSKLCFIVPIV